MKLQTKYFGEIEINATESLRFETPLYGFEHIEAYVLLHDDEADSPFCWLQAMNDVDVCFVLTDPQVIASDYRPQMSDEDRSKLNFSDSDEPVYRLITIVPENLEDATVNLKSPVVINTREKKAAQIILEEDYPVRAPLLQKGDATC